MDLIILLYSLNVDRSMYRSYSPIVFLIKSIIDEVVACSVSLHIDGLSFNVSTGLTTEMMDCKQLSHLCAKQGNP